MLGRRTWLNSYGINRAFNSNFVRMNQAYWSERNVPQRFDQLHPTTLRLTKSIVNLRAFLALAFSDLDPEPILWRVLLLRHNRPAGHARPPPSINSLYQLYGARSFTIAVASAR